MGIFENFILNEAPAQAPPQQAPPKNNQEVQPPPDPPDLTGGGGGNAQQEQDPNVGGGDPNAQDPNMSGGDPNAAEGEDPNAQDPNMAGGDPNAAEGEDPNAQDPNAGGEEMPQGPEDEIQQSEQEIFGDLKPEQMDIKIKELKKVYKTLFLNVEEMLEKINKISRTTYDDSMLDMLVRKIVLLKTILRDSLNDAFDTRSYVDNKMEIERLINVYNNISKSLDEICTSRIKRRDKIEEINTKTNKGFNKSQEFPVLFSRGFDDQ